MALSRFDTVEPTPDQSLRLEATRNAFRCLELQLDALQRSPSREYSLALTHLEQAAMWAIKGISREADRADLG